MFASPRGALRPAGPLPCRSISRLGVLDVPHMEDWELGKLVFHSLLFFPQRYAVHVELHVSSSFPSAEWRNKMERKKKRKEQENLWLQDKLLTSTYNTGPDGFV
jgi:hypothetical protein